MRVGLYGSFAQQGPFPLDVNTGWFKFNTWAFGQSDMPGTAIHEFYHFIQARYTGTMLENQYSSYGWVKEAGSTWMEEKAPETIGVFRNSFFQSQRSDLFLGLYPAPHSQGWLRQGSHHEVCRGPMGERPGPADLRERAGWNREPWTRCSRPSPRRRPPGGPTS